MTRPYADFCVIVVDLAESQPLRRTRCGGDGLQQQRGLGFDSIASTRLRQYSRSDISGSPGCLTRWCST
jgi:hypothetical protein